MAESPGQKYQASSRKMVVVFQLWTGFSWSVQYFERQSKKMLYLVVIQDCSHLLSYIIPALCICCSRLVYVRYFSLLLLMEAICLLLYLYIPSVPIAIQFQPSGMVVPQSGTNKPLSNQKGIGKSDLFLTHFSCTFAMLLIQCSVFFPNWTLLLVTKLIPVLQFQYLDS